MSWLKDFLTSPINKALLSTEVYEKLNHALANTPTYLPNNLWEKETPQIYTPPRPIASLGGVYDVCSQLMW